MADLSGESAIDGLIALSFITESIDSTVDVAISETVLA
jgi:hypothetical protein